MADKYVVEFDSCEEMDAIKGVDIPAVMYSGYIYNAETDFGANFDYVPLTGEIDFPYDYYGSQDEFYDRFDLIRDTARKIGNRAYYIAADGTPFIAEQVEDGVYTYRRYWRLFNSVDGYWTVTDPEYLINAYVTDSTGFMNAMIGYAWRKDNK